MRMSEQKNYLKTDRFLNSAMNQYVLSCVATPFVSFYTLKS
jgi:hypothetical protein